MTRSTARRALDHFAEILSPTTCVACPVPVARDRLYCVACLATVLPPKAHDPRSLAVAAYGGAASLAVIAMKYTPRPDLARRLGEAMAERADGLRGWADVVVPVPLHPRRLAERGFDQASLLAAPIAASLGVPRLLRALCRRRDTPRQASLDREHRLLNVGGAFFCRPIQARRVLLVDDVRTTGATLGACTESLLFAGADEVVTLVFAAKDRGLSEA